MATTLFEPKALPKLDFAKGVPTEFTTMVVVPTLLTSEEQMVRAVRDLEIRFLANRDANIHFALLTDPPDAAQQFDDKDKLAGQCALLIEAMNAKYSAEGKGSFFLFHRHRAYNPSEGIWMAWERKRGKLLDFNKFLLGTSDNFPVKAGNLALLPLVKYVITLDSDTQLPRDAARRLAGAIAHPLNRAVIDPTSNTVVLGSAAQGSVAAPTGLKAEEQAAWDEIMARRSDSEVICIIRSKDSAKSEVITLNHLSPEFVDGLIQQASRAPTAGPIPA